MTSTEISAASAVYLGSTAAEAMYIGSTLIWLQGGGSVVHNYSQDYFTIESLQDSNTITAVKNGSTINPVIYYSLDDGTTWNNQTLSSGTITFGTINEGEKIIFKCTNSNWATDWNKYNRFSSSKNFKVYGNVMSLLNGDNFLSNSEFESGSSFNLCGLFYGTTTIVDASDLILPATTLYLSSYNGMFRGCTNLTTAPLLPGLYSATDCYSSMFEGCINLETAPEINLTNMSSACCKRMFCMNRSSKITTPRMTKGPVLRVATPATNCYEEMFKGNGNINEVTCLITTSNVSCTNNWLANAGNGSGTFKKSPLKSDWTLNSASSVPTGWTVTDYVES